MKRFNALKKYAPKVAIGTGLVTLAGSANAALPTPVTDGITAMIATVSDVETAVWPLIMAVLTAVFIITMVKKFAKKAS